MTAFILKIIALVTMVIDHTGAVIPGMPGILRVIGRVAFPVYVFFIAEGAKYTKNYPKFLLRLFAFAVISQIPFALAFHGGSISPEFPFFENISFIRDTNVFYTLTLGAMGIYVFKLLKQHITIVECNKLLQTIIIIAVTFIFGCLAEKLSTDYSSIGVGLIIFTYFADKKILKLGVLSVGVLLLYTPLTSICTELVKALREPGFFENAAYIFKIYIRYYLEFGGYAYAIGGLVSVVLLAFYNGKRGPSLKWAFYAAYPVHIALLVIIAALFF